MMKYFGLCLMLLSLISCSGKTTVLLLPEDDGSVGMVEVRGEEASQVITTPNSYTVVDALSASPAPVKEMSTDEIEKRFSTVIKAQPKKPIAFSVYFELGSTELVEKSQTIIQDVLLEIKERQPCEVSVIGHSDRMGSRSYNINLSLKRASAVEKILRASSLEIGEIGVSSHGENEPVIKTPDGTPESLNRRVEIIVR
jgi:outer membrane protein OmpA-like peptidoglycan-associated protein